MTKLYDRKQCKQQSYLMVQLIIQTRDSDIGLT